MSCHVPLLARDEANGRFGLRISLFFSFSALASVKVSSNCFSAPSSNCFPAPAALRPLLPGFGTAPETVGDAANYWTRLSLFFSSLSLHFYYSFLPFFPLSYPFHFSIGCSSSRQGHQAPGSKMDTTHQPC